MQRVLQSRWWFIFHLLVYGTIAMLFADVYCTRVTHTQLRREAPFLEVKDTIESRLASCEARIDALEEVRRP